MQRPAESQQPSNTGATGNQATAAVTATGAQGANQPTNAQTGANQAAGATGGQAQGTAPAGGAAGPHQGQITKGMKDRAESAKAYIESKYQKLMRRQPFC